jgi:hypothetical protein
MNGMHTKYADDASGENLSAAWDCWVQYTSVTGGGAFGGDAQGCMQCFDKFVESDVWREFEVDGGRLIVEVPACCKHVSWCRGLAVL